MEENKSVQSWIKPRHARAMNAVRAVMSPLSRILYGIDVQKYSQQTGNDSYLILYNHQTPFDQFFIGMAFDGPIYYLATEDIFSNGFISSIIRYCVAPIPIKKATTDINAVRNCFRVAKEGGTIAIAPEGNRTYSGRTGNINPAIATMAKKMKLPIAFFRIEGGYGVEPRWSSVRRKGKMCGYVSRVISTDELETMSADDIQHAIEKELFVDECASGGLFRSRKKAEHIERAIYWCPFCGFSKFTSRGNTVECCSCHRKITYGEDKRLSGKGFPFPFEYMTQWYDAQSAYVNSLDTQNMTGECLFTDNADIYLVVVYKKKIRLRRAAVIRLYGDRISIGERGENPQVICFDDVISATAMGRNKLNINLPDAIYQIRGENSFNPLKYVNLYYRYKNITRGEPNAEFLGL